GFLALLAGSFRAVGAGPAGSTRLCDEVAEGTRFVWRHPVLRPLAIMLGLQNMAFSAAFSVFVLFAVAPGPMGLSDAGYGVLTATLGVGSLLGTWLAARVERRLGRVRTLVLSIVLNGISLVVPVVTALPVPIGTSMLASGAGIVFWNVVTVSLRQRITPDRLLGRMNASYRLVGWGTIPLGAALGGVLAEALGLRGAFLVAALVTFTVLIGFRYVTEESIARAEAAEAPQAPTG
ncbi:MAG TPA: MFS transporter, partial [Actinomycetes bacterium]|nr:MFS transporter [Actinomycetes bacterium]